MVEKYLIDSNILIEYLGLCYDEEINQKNHQHYR